jgi:hypothetical protein
VLLLWVMHSARDLTIQDLKAILHAHGRESSLKLFRQICDQFSTFFVITPRKNIPSAVVKLASESIADYLRNAAGSQTVTFAQKDDRVSQAEIRLVKNFLRAFCEPALYSKLGFHTLFEDKAGSADATIIDPETANAHEEILVKCLSCINGKYGDEAQWLTYYADSHLDHHFKMIEDLSLVDAAWKSEAGVQLAKFLTSSKTADVFGLRRRNLWFQDSLTDEISRFLDNGAVPKDSQTTSAFG